MCIYKDLFSAYHRTRASEVAWHDDGVDTTRHTGGDAACDEPRDDAVESS